MALVVLRFLLARAGVTLLSSSAAASSLVDLAERPRLPEVDLLPLVPLVPLPAGVEGGAMVPLPARRFSDSFLSL